jgi:hypothetical protein
MTNVGMTNEKQSAFSRIGRLIVNEKIVNRQLLVIRHFNI